MGKHYRLMGLSQNTFLLQKAQCIGLLLGHMAGTLNNINPPVPNMGKDNNNI